MTGAAPAAREGVLSRTEVAADVGAIKAGSSSASSSRTPTTRNVLRPSGIVSPGPQLGTALVSVGGSADAPSAVSSLNRKAIRSLLSGAGRRWRVYGESKLSITERKEFSVVARVNFLQTAPGRIDDVTRVVRDVVHPGIRQEGGYVGYIVLGDQETGRALGVTLWESGETREASDATARQIRPRVEEETGGRGNVLWSG